MYVLTSFWGFVSRSVSTSVRPPVFLAALCVEAHDVRIAHPDPTIHPMKLKDFAKKLKEYYGWNEEAFLKATQRGD